MLEPAQVNLRTPRSQQWERGIGEAEAGGAGPVRRIPVTAAMQEADRLHQQRSTANPMVTAWRARVLGGRMYSPQERK